MNIRIMFQGDISKKYKKDFLGSFLRFAESEIHQALSYDIKLDETYNLNSMYSDCIYSISLEGDELDIAVGTIALETVSSDFQLLHSEIKSKIKMCWHKFIDNIQG
ncbi:hypothetical protein [Haemophilus haemolyticus]|uniref:Uncharacterized protein n=1 Tax=Haemophilus haemolyticus TaxID=726 RepID=A0A2X4R690_HAEHA|nr:hypothetical protein [Haemophilus haemolyticus]SQH97311.1 Uncharacterised protein [Haemophilus haemolyticus]